jgi:hypothetical protein
MDQRTTCHSITTPDLLQITVIASFSHRLSNRAIYAFFESTIGGLSSMLLLDEELAEFAI